MTSVSRCVAWIGGVAAVAVAAGVLAQGQQVYRYVDKDGRIIYSDRAPPPDSKEVQAKRLTPNLIESNDLPIATAQATQKFPVTLYTFPCGTLCQNAEALLNRRGVPFSTVNVEDQKGAEMLKALTGGQEVPVLQVGDKLVAKGFNEARWTAMLDEAGYPKTPARRTVQRAAAPETPAPAPAPAPPPPPPSDAAQATPAPGTGYPK